MANVTISVNEDLLEKARLRAAQQGTSVDIVLRDYLESYVGDSSVREEAVYGFLEIAHNSPAGSGGKRWTRDELYER